jgi:hypothetical protein
MRISCLESDESVLTQIYDSSGNALSMGEIVCIINSQQSELAKANEDETCRLCGFQPAACQCKQPTQGEGE